jgi:glycosyltransferase involved in cell wall biosynthesis
MFHGAPKLLLEEHGRFYPEEDKPARRRVNRAVIVPLSHRFVAVSEDVRWRLDRYEGLDAARVDVIYNGVDVGPRLTSTERLALRQTLRFTEHDIVIGTVGRFDPIKNLPMFIESLAAAREQNSRIRGLLVGDGPEFGAVKALLGTHGLEDAVHLTGFRSDARQLVQCLDLFVLSSFSEGTSMALLEAMASGVPAVVTAVGGNPEIVVAGETGWVVPSGAVAALTSAVLDAAADESLRRDFGRAGRQRFEDNFTFGRMIECYRELYRSMMPSSVRKPA